VPGTDAFRVESFAEKPDEATAAAYVAEGRLWNGGYLLFRADAMLAEFEAHAPAVLEAARAALALAQTDLDFVRLDAGALQAAPKVSIDYAVMERTTRAGVLPAAFPWSDIGTWDAVWDLSPHDPDGNALTGAVEALGTRNCLVRSEGLLTTVIGLEDAIVVATPDAVLVASRRHAGMVREAVAALRLKNHPEADVHLRSYRPWGWHQRIDRGPRFQCKRIVVNPGGRLSLQKHHHRAEHWVVVRGTAEVTVDGRVTTVHENEGAYIPIGSVHRLANPGRIPLELIEVQVGSYTGEDDIVRIEDAYGR
jgi:mannose-1-phosphate guanylyltransferase/mannose-6-phosphate isomerase